MIRDSWVPAHKLICSDVELLLDGVTCVASDDGMPGIAASRNTVLSRPSRRGILSGNMAGRYDYGGPCAFPYACECEHNGAENTEHSIQWKCLDTAKFAG